MTANHKQTTRLSQIRQPNTTERLYFHLSLSCIGEGMATHSSFLAWRIPGTGESCGLPSMGSQSRTRLKQLSSSSNSKASLVAQRLKCLPAMRETWVRSLGWEDPLEKEMASHSSVLAWRIPGMGEPGGLLSMRSHRVGHD